MKMSKTDILKFTVIFALTVSVILFLFSGSRGSLAAQVSGQGSTFLTPPVVEEFSLEQGPVHSAAMVEPKVSGKKEFVIGMLLILLGFGLHAMFVTKREQSVHITTKKHPRKKGKSHYWEWYHIEIWP